MSGVNQHSIASAEQNTVAAAAVEENDVMRAQIFKLNVDCFEKLFDYLPLLDLYTLRLTCKRMKQVVSYYIKLNYLCNQQMCFGLLCIHHYNEKGFRQGDFNGFELIKGIAFLNTFASDTSIVASEDLKILLNQVESVHFLNNNLFNGDLSESILKHCTCLKHLEINGSDEIIGKGNEWLHQRHPTLERITLRNFTSSTIRMPELKSIFERNLDVRTFSTDSNFLWWNRKWILGSNLRFDQLDIFLVDRQQNMDDVCSLLVKLYEQGFYRRLHFTYMLIDKIELHRLTSLHALEGLHFIETSHASTILWPLVSIEEFTLNNHGFSVRNVNFEALASRLPNINKIYFLIYSIDDILPFICQCPLLIEIKLNFKNKITID